MVHRLLAYLRWGPKHKRQRSLVAALVAALPAELNEGKTFARVARCHGLYDTASTLGFAFIAWSYAKLPDGLPQRGTNLRISGAWAAAFSGEHRISIDLFVQDGMPRGVRIESGDYAVVRFDPNGIVVSDLRIEPYAFPPTEAELFIQGLDDDIRRMLDPQEIRDVEVNRRTYFTFHDLEDGNYLALDKSMRIWSLVHDARPMAKLMKVDLKELLTAIKQGRFSTADHLDARYRNARS